MGGPVTRFHYALSFSCTTRDIIYYYKLKQWIVHRCALFGYWNVLFTSKKLVNVAYITRKMVSRSPTVTNEEISQINEEAVHANTKKAAKFGWQFLQVKLDLFRPKFIDETFEKAFGYKCKYIVRKFEWLTRINDIKLSTFVPYYRTVLVYSNTTIHLSVGSQ